MPLDISVSRQYGDNTVTLRTNLPVTKSGPSPASRSSPMDLGSAGASDLPADRPGGVARLVSTASFFGDEQQGGPRQRRGSYLSEEQGVASEGETRQRSTRKLRRTSARCRRDGGGGTTYAESDQESGEESGGV